MSVSPLESALLTSAFVTQAPMHSRWLKLRHETELHLSVVRAHDNVRQCSQGTPSQTDSQTDHTYSAGDNASREVSPFGGESVYGSYASAPIQDTTRAADNPSKGVQHTQLCAVNRPPRSARDESEEAEGERTTEAPPKRRGASDHVKLEKHA